MQSQHALCPKPVEGFERLSGTAITCPPCSGLLPTVAAAGAEFLLLALTVLNVHPAALLAKAELSYGVPKRHTNGAADVFSLLREC